MLFRICWTVMIQFIDTIVFNRIEGAEKGASE